MPPPPAVADLTLYHYPLSRSLRVLFLLHELGVAEQVTVRSLKLMHGEGYSEEFLKLNPFHAVPVITFTDATSGERRVMLESPAIVRFLAGVFRGWKDLVPLDRASPSDVSEFEQWYAFVTVTMDMVLWQIRIINDFRGRPEREESILDFYTQKWNNEILPELDRHLSRPNQEFVSTNLGFTILDVVMGQTLNWSFKYVAAGLIHPPTPAVKAYIKRIISRPAWKASVRDGHLFENDSKM